MWQRVSAGEGSIRRAEGELRYSVVFRELRAGVRYAPSRIPLLGISRTGYCSGLGAEVIRDVMAFPTAGAGGNGVWREEG